MDQSFPSAAAAAAATAVLLNALVPWNELSAEKKEWDSSAVGRFNALLFLMYIHIHVWV